MEATAKKRPKALTSVTNPADVKLDDDIAAFVLEDLEDRDIDAALQDNLVQKAAGLASGKGQCHAMNNVKNATLRNRCSSYSKKGTNLCDRHFKVREAGKLVVKVD